MDRMSLNSRSTFICVVGSNTPYPYEAQANVTPARTAHPASAAVSPT